MKNLAFLLPVVLLALASCSGKGPSGQGSGPEGDGGSATSNQPAEQSPKGMPLSAAIVGRFVKISDYADGKYPTTKSCNIDLITDASTGHMESSIPSGHSIGFSGWGADGDRQVAPALVFVILRGGDVFATSGSVGVGEGEDMPGIADDHMKKFRFNIAASTVGIPKGPYKVALVLDFGQKQQLCPMWTDISID